MLALMVAPGEGNVKAKAKGKTHEAHGKGIK
jgi:hypothetical protein